MGNTAARLGPEGTKSSSWAAATAGGASAEAGGRPTLLLVLPPGGDGAQAFVAAAAPQYEVQVVSSEAEALDHRRSWWRGGAAAAVWCREAEEDAWRRRLRRIRSEAPHVLLIALLEPPAHRARHRLACFAAGARMVADARDTAAVRDALARHRDTLASATRCASGKLFTCPGCGLGGLDEVGLRRHVVLFHQCEPNIVVPCPVCAKAQQPLTLHLHNEHGPLAEREPTPPPYDAFAWCVVRRPRDGKFLLVNEPAPIAGGRPRFWFPAGRVDAGETLVRAAVRECIEEASVRVKPVGVLMLLPERELRALRVVLLCEPSEPCDPNAAFPKAVPDFESCGACWVGMDELPALGDDAYRSGHVRPFLSGVASGELETASLATEAWRTLEDAIMRTTRGDAPARAVLDVWPRVRAAYPALCR